MESIKNRYEIMFIIEAEMCNHNGDPDMGNLPRVDEETQHGILTDVAVKRRIRNYIQDAFEGVDGMEILMRNGTSLNRAIAEEAVPAKKETLEDNETLRVLRTQERMCLRYWDVRTFGGVLSTGMNAGQVRGAVQLTLCRSADPIHIEDMTITRMCYTTSGGNDKVSEDVLAQLKDEEAKRADDAKRTMGEKKIEAYGLYVVKASVSAGFAAKTGFTEADLNALFEAILQCYNHDISSSKMGMNVISPVIIFKHVGTQHANNAAEKAREAKLGCAPAHKLFDLLKVRKKEDVEFPRSKGDYDISLSMDTPDGVEIGIKESPFGPVVWGKENILAEGIDTGCVALC